MIVLVVFWNGYNPKQNEVNMEVKYWKKHNMNVELVGRTIDNKFPVIRLLQPIYKYKNIVAHPIGTEIVVTDSELED